MPLRKYSVQSNHVERTLINIASGKSNRLSHLQRKHYNQYLSQVLSLLLLQLSKSVVHCSIEGNFHLVVKAVFFNFLASLSFGSFVFLLAPYPSNTTQISLTHLHLPHPSDSYPPTWRAYSTNAYDALYVQHFLSQLHCSTSTA